MLKNDEKIIQQYLDDYVKELEEVEDFFEYFGDWSEDKPNGEIYGVSWILGGWNTSRDGLDYEGVKVWTGFNSPATWIDTYKGTAGISWGCEKMEKELSRETISKIDNFFEDYFICCM